MEREPVIPDEVRAELKALVPIRAAQRLLTTPVVPGVPPFGAMAARVAAMSWRLFQFARAGMLAGRPAYEARETFNHRVRSSMKRGRTMSEWAVGLAKGLRVDFAKLPVADRIEWIVICGATTPRDWTSFKRSPTEVEDMLTAAALLGEWMYELRNEAPDAPPAST